MHLKFKERWMVLSTCFQTKTSSTATAISTESQKFCRNKNFCLLMRTNNYIRMKVLLSASKVIMNFKWWFSSSRKKTISSNKRLLQKTSSWVNVRAKFRPNLCLSPFDLKLAIRECKLLVQGARHTTMQYHRRLIQAFKGDHHQKKASLLFH